MHLDVSDDGNIDVGESFEDGRGQFLNALGPLLHDGEKELGRICKMRVMQHDNKILQTQFR